MPGQQHLQIIFNAGHWRIQLIRLEVFIKIWHVRLSPFSNGLLTFINEQHFSLTPPIWSTIRTAIKWLFVTIPVHLFIEYILLYFMQKSTEPLTDFIQTIIFVLWNDRFKWFFRLNENYLQKKDKQVTVAKIRNLSSGYGFV